MGKVSNMPGSLNDSGIRDNHRRGNVADFLKSKLKTGSRHSVVSAYFTIYAYEALKDQLDNIEHLDFLFGEPRFITSLGCRVRPASSNSLILATRPCSPLLPSCSE
jgi:hypothetical protein